MKTGIVKGEAGDPTEKAFGECVLAKKNSVSCGPELQRAHSRLGVEPRLRRFGKDFRPESGTISGEALLVSATTFGGVFCFPSEATQ